MTNPLTVIADAFKSYSKVPDIPLSVNEVSNLWMFLTATENFMSSEAVAYNIVKDEDLRKSMKDLIDNYHKKVITDTKAILLAEGVPLAHPPADKPLIKMEVPSPARMSDEEVANLVVFNLVWAIKHCSRGLVESTRADVGALFGKYIAQKTLYSLTLRQLLYDKGWLKVPPPYIIPNRINQ